jgi:methionyl-tRNA formyltransferase
MRVVFMGTPDFAVTTLKAISNSAHEVVGVVTAPDKPAGRGLLIQCSEVKKFAVENRIPMLQPEKLKDPIFIETLNSWQADIFVVVAFRMLPFEVYSIPPKGTVNVHASLLPQYRGAAPIHRAIMNGETKTGITTFFLNREMDCGDIILQREIEILPQETTGELYDRLKLLGAELALDTLTSIEKGEVVTQIQSHLDKTALKLAPKINKEDMIIDWGKPAQDIINKIRGLSPHPGAVTFLKNMNNKSISLKIFNASILYEKPSKKEGKIETDDKSFLHISSKDFQISIHKLQMEGKKKVDTDIFLQGNKVSIYTIL